jgi:hypothetical protein
MTDDSDVVQQLSLQVSGREGTCTVPKACLTETGISLQTYPAIGLNESDGVSTTLAWSDFWEHAA